MRLPRRVRRNNDLAQDYNMRCAAEFRCPQELSRIRNATWPSWVKKTLRKFVRSLVPETYRKSKIRKLRQGFGKRAIKIGVFDTFGEF
jgi:hypothetical protein